MFKRETLNNWSMNSKTTEKLSLEYWKSQLDEIWLEKIQMIHKGKDIEEIIGFAYADLISQPERMERATGNDFKRLVNTWLSNKRPVIKKPSNRLDLTNL